MGAGDSIRIRRSAAHQSREHNKRSGLVAADISQMATRSLGHIYHLDRTSRSRGARAKTVHWSAWSFVSANTCQWTCYVYIPPGTSIGLRRPVLASVRISLTPKYTRVRVSLSVLLMNACTSYMDVKCCAMWRRMQAMRCVTSPGPLARLRNSRYAGTQNTHVRRPAILRKLPPLYAHNHHIRFIPRTGFWPTPEPRRWNHQSLIHSL